MRLLVGAVLVLIGTVSPCLAEDERAPSSITTEQREAVSDKKAAEIKASSRQAQKRRDSVDASYKALMARWALAVCIGCEPGARPTKILHTYPLRVLAGYAAADDDTRERRGRRIPL